MTDLDAAIESILAASRPGGCWATRLEGDAALLVERLKEEEQRGNKPGRVATQKVLKEAFGISVSEERIRSHLQGLCSCG